MMKKSNDLDKKKWDQDGGKSSNLDWDKNNTIINNKYNSYKVIINMRYVINSKLVACIKCQTYSNIKQVKSEYYIQYKQKAKLKNGRY